MTYRKLRVLLNTAAPHTSRVIDIESGEEILTEDLQIVCSRMTGYKIEVHLVLKVPDGIEVMTIEEPVPELQPESPFLGREEEGPQP